MTRTKTKYQGEMGIWWISLKIWIIGQNKNTRASPTFTPTDLISVHWTDQTWFSQTLQELFPLRWMLFYSDLHMADLKCYNLSETHLWSPTPHSTIIFCSIYFSYLFVNYIFSPTAIVKKLCYIKRNYCLVFTTMFLAHK